MNVDDLQGCELDPLLAFFLIGIDHLANKVFNDLLTVRLSGASLDFHLEDDSLHVLAHVATEVLQSSNLLQDLLVLQLLHRDTDYVLLAILPFGPGAGSALVKDVLGLWLVGRVCLHLLQDLENLLMHEADKTILLSQSFGVSRRILPLELIVLFVPDKSNEHQRRCECFLHREVLTQELVLLKTRLSLTTRDNPVTTQQDLVHVAFDQDVLDQVERETLL